MWTDYLTPELRAQRQVQGTLKILPGLWSPQLENRRDILVHLPASYAHGDRRYPVVYMQDAQNLFDHATSYAGQDWQADETLERLAREGLEVIAVGIPHMGEQRIAEYNPFPGHFPGRGETYVRFLTETLKPLIDRDFRTRPERASTGLLGSSMGGLISLYGFFRAPAVFGFVGAMSPALWVSSGAVYRFVREAPFAAGRIYLDNGSKDNDARHMQALLLEKGYRAETEVRHLFEDGAEHTESAWARRLPNALRFLLGR